MAILAIVSLVFSMNSAQAVKLLPGKQIEIERGDVLERVCRRLIAEALVNSYNVHDCLSETRQANPGWNLNKIRQGERFAMPQLVLNYMQLAGLEAEPVQPAPVVTAPPATTALPLTPETKSTPAPSSPIIGSPPVDSQEKPILVTTDEEIPESHFGVPTLPRPTNLAGESPSTKEVFGFPPVVSLSASPVEVPTQLQLSPASRGYGDDMSLQEVMAMRQAAEIRLAAARNALIRHTRDVEANAKIPHGTARHPHRIVYETFDLPPSGTRTRLYAFEAAEAARHARDEAGRLLEIIRAQEGIILGANQRIAARQYRT